MRRNGKRYLRSALPIVLLAAALPLTILATAPGTVSRTPIARKHLVPLPPSSLYIGGTAPAFTAEIVPDAVVTTKGIETIEYHAELTSLVERQGAVAWSASIFDDRGILVQDLGKGQQSVAPKGTVVTPGLSAALPDGYYVLHVRAALSGTDTDEVSEARQYLAVSHGSMKEMSYDDWSQVSRDTIAVLLPNAITPSASPVGGAK